jgi:myosin light chain 6
VDAFFVGDVLRALNLAPTQKLVEKLGGTKKRNEKKLKVEEFLPMFAQAKKDKDVGNIEDFTEILKLYDKAGDGKMPYAELNHILQSLGIFLNSFNINGLFCSSFLTSLVSHF